MNATRGVSPALPSSVAIRRPCWTAATELMEVWGEPGVQPLEILDDHDQPPEARRAVEVRHLDDLHDRRAEAPEALAMTVAVRLANQPQRHAARRERLGRPLEVSGHDHDVIDPDRAVVVLCCRG